MESSTIEKEVNEDSQEKKTLTIKHVIEVEFLEEIDITNVETDKSGTDESKKANAKKITEVAHNFKDKIEKLCDEIEAEGLTKAKVVYGLQKPFCAKQALKELLNDLQGLLD